MANSYNGPDLASVLRNLSAYTTPAAPQNAPVAPPPPPPAPVQSNAFNHSTFIAREEGEIDEYEPPENSAFNLSSQDPQLQLPQQQQQASPLSFLQQPSTSPHQLFQHHAQQSQASPPSPSQPLPSSDPHKPPTSSSQPITTWPPALRHVTTLSARNPSFIPRIKQLISSQHTHERQWWNGREQLIKKIQNREASRKKLDEVLAVVGGKRGTLASMSEDSGAGGSGGEKRKRGEGGTLNDDDHDDEGPANEEEKETKKKMEMEMDAEGQKELLMYDRKVLRASKEMASATEKELESLGVPFFGKDVEKIMVSTKKVEMNALREKMVAFLEELCGE